MRRPFSRAWICLLIATAGAAADTRLPDGDPGHPPIPVRFALAEPGFVTLVVEDAAGMRVRNLVSETPFPKGENVAWWDGLDDLGRDTDAARHAVYHVPGKLVAAGTYRVRGLVRPAVDLRYEMTAYHPGDPPWLTKDRGSGWLANHTPPSAVLFVPPGAAPEREGRPAPRGQVLVGSFVSEGGSGLAWLDADGRKLHGQEWVGGVWTGATHLCRDEGDHPVPGVYAYTGSAWRGDKYNGNQPELRLHMLVNGQGKLKTPGDKRLGTGEDPAVLTPTYKLPADLADPEHSDVPALGGLAARDGVLVAAVTPLDRLVFVDAAARRTLATAALDKPRGLAFDKEGRLLAVSGRRVVRLAMPRLDRSAATTQPATLAEPQVLVADGLDEPQQVALDRDGNLYVSDRGASNQVKVFSPDGRPLRAIGTPGKAKVGPYDPEHMHRPNGLTVDRENRLWVAETDHVPKRLSVWTLDGKLVNAFYGPPQYGGGGSVDPADKTRFFYADSGGGTEFKLDWASGTSRPAAVYARPELDPLRDWLRPERSQAPDTPLHVGDRLYLTDAYTTNPTGGVATASLWLLTDGVARPVASVGQCNNHPSFDAAYKPPKPKGGQAQPAAKSPRLASRLPAGVDLRRDRVLFLWSDLNDDGRVQPDEVACAKGETLSVNFRGDLSAVTGSGLLVKPARVTPGGAPVFDAAGVTTFVADTQRPVSSGGGQAVLAADGRFALTNAPKPFSAYGLGGGKDGRATWSYPSLWPGLHASHNAAMPERPGELIGTTRLLGPPVTPAGSDVGEVFAVNGNKGNVYLFTTDGLFLATLFRDGRTASWDPPGGRGTLVNDQSIKEEDFFPTVSQTADGAIYLSVLNCCLVRVEGLEKARRLVARELTVSGEQLAAARQFFVRQETARQAEQQRDGGKTLTVALTETAPTVDGDLKDWDGAAWVTIDERVTQVGDWGHKKVATRAAVRVAGGRLYAAFQTDEAKGLVNRGDSPQNLFKTGACLDLMIGSDPAADPGRDRPAAGDERLLVTRVKGRTVAMLYRQVAPGGVKPSGGAPAEYTSPVKSVRFDDVVDVSGQVELAEGERADPKEKVTGGTYELSVPLEVLGLRPKRGQVLRGDVGVLRGNGYETLQRAYWSNKAGGLVSDLPSEAELTPRLWGTWVIQ
jgi:hypothetical protein